MDRSTFFTLVADSLSALFHGNVFPVVAAMRIGDDELGPLSHMEFYIRHKADKQQKMDVSPSSALDHGSHAQPATPLDLRHLTLPAIERKWTAMLGRRTLAAFILFTGLQLYLAAQIADNKPSAAHRSLATTHSTGEVEMQTYSNYAVLSGGTAKNHWELKYAFPTSLSSRKTGPPTTLAAGPNHRAYFANGSWLRVIDAQTGTVLQRWPFAGLIRKI